jgi:hypothetical protein
MSTKTKHFDMFGVEYKTTQFPAIIALAVMENAEKIHPTENLRQTYAKEGDQWIALDSRYAINRLVVDKAFIIPPQLVLRAVLKAVNEFSFGFVNGWRGVKIPTRFTSGSATRESKHVDPLIAQLLQEEVANLRELEEYYSLEDAFKMFDVMVAKGVNAALAQEEATKMAKR